MPGTDYNVEGYNVVRPEYDQPYLDGAVFDPRLDFAKAGAAGKDAEEVAADRERVRGERRDAFKKADERRQKEREEGFKQATKGKRNSDGDSTNANADNGGRVGPAISTSKDPVKFDSDHRTGGDRNTSTDSSTDKNVDKPEKTGNTTTAPAAKKTTSSTPTKKTTSARKVTSN